MRGSRGPVGRNLGPRPCPAAPPRPLGPSSTSARDGGPRRRRARSQAVTQPWGPRCGAAVPSAPARPGHRPPRRERSTAGDVKRSAAPVRAGASAPGEGTGVRRSRAAVQASAIRRQHGPEIRRTEREREGRSPRRPALAPHSGEERGHGSAGLLGSAKGWQPRSPGCLTADWVGAAPGTAGRAPAANGFRSSSQVGIGAIQARMHTRSVHVVPSNTHPTPGAAHLSPPTPGNPSAGSARTGIPGAVHNAGSPSSALRPPRAPAGTTSLSRAGLTRGRPQVTRGWHLSADPEETGAGHVGPRAPWKRTLRPSDPWAAPGPASPCSHRHYGTRGHSGSCPTP